MLLGLLSICVACGSDEDPITSTNPDIVAGDTTDPANDDLDEDSFAPIDFAHWKVTLPVDEDNNGKPDEYQPEALVQFRYQTNTAIQPYMFDDTSDTSLVFYTIPGATTANSSYPRTELRELIDPSSARVNWSLEDGGILEGDLKVDSISRDMEDTSREYHRSIVMQIHGIISEEDMALYGFSSNNGPPLIKMYWKDGTIWSHKKSLVDETTEGSDLLQVDDNIWTDEKVAMGYVGFEPFHLKIVATDGRLEIILNAQETLVYEDISLAKWPFLNYFKAGNYLQTTAVGSFATVKYYDLTITH